MARAGGRKNTGGARKPAAKPAKQKKPAPGPPPEPTPPPALGTDLGEYQDWHEYQSRLDRPVMMKIPEFEQNGRLRHVIFSRQFTRNTLDRIYQVTSKLR